MSLHNFCFFSVDASVVSDRIQALISSHPEDFPSATLFGRVKIPDECFVEDLWDEYQFAAKSLVLFELPKSSSDKVEARRVQLVKEIFGDENSCIIFDGNIHMRI